MIATRPNSRPLMLHRGNNYSTPLVNSQIAWTRFREWLGSKIWEHRVDWEAGKATRPQLTRVNAAGGAWSMSTVCRQQWGQVCEQRKHFFAHMQKKHSRWYAFNSTISNSVPGHSINSTHWKYVIGQLCGSSLMYSETCWSSNWIRMNGKGFKRATHLCHKATEHVLWYDRWVYGLKRMFGLENEVLWTVNTTATVFLWSGKYTKVCATICFKQSRLLQSHNPFSDRAFKNPLQWKWYFLCFENVLVAIFCWWMALYK